MSSTLFTTRAIVLVLLGGMLATLAACPAAKLAQSEASGNGSDGVYYAAPNKLFDKDGKFDIRWKVTHEPQVDTFNPATNVDSRQLAIARCTQCHECGFSTAFDLTNYNNGKAWHPKYKGEQWSTPVTRMMRQENSFVNNEVIAERIYNWLKKETTEGYDEATDTKGAVTIETDANGNPIQHPRAKTPQK